MPREDKAVTTAAKLFTVFLLRLASTGVLAAGMAAHVVVVVWNGMRPDFVTPETTPTLFNLAKQGVTFRNQHAGYLKWPEVNGELIPRHDAGGN